MKYYENEMGIFISAVVPAGARELTKEEFTARLEEIRRTTAQRAAEAENTDGEENNDN